ncbi:MAG: saccharopine dehydrogenase C-terminal domain-containing protein [Bacteroidales bacterium]|nr:saccharopine dehydrogenase C-terminal domain-containing protein [Bacteroidales bacterium]MDT8431598.1 saccharopine dehydrogenase C-terminal domain-containing protein [Bacteroidales bacterium]
MPGKIIVLGAGLVGSAIAADLHLAGYDVVSADLDPAALKKIESMKGIRTRKADFMQADVLRELVEDKDLVVGAAPGAVGYQLMEQVIRLGKNMVDISFCPEDYLQLDRLAKENGVTVVADMGVAPGMCNAILGFHDRKMEVESYKCIVGGLPVKRTWPLEYKSSWSPIDCIEEYTRPARLVRNGKIITLPALSEAALVEFDEAGTLEEWNSDGLRSLLVTMLHIPDMVEKTLRYPGTINYIKALRELGYFSYEKIEVGGELVRPIDLTAKLLFPLWKLDQGEAEFTVMRVTITGKEAGLPVTYQYDLYDRYDARTDTLSMSRTTGFTCAGTADLVLKNRVTAKGVLAPEVIGGNEADFHHLMDYLAARGVLYRVSKC